jgi:hypothetical protein
MSGDTNSTSTSPEQTIEASAIEYNKRTPRQFQQRLFQNAQLALINLSSNRAGHPGPISKANKRYYTQKAHSSAAQSFESVAGGAGSVSGNKAWASGYRIICPIESSAQYPPDVLVSTIVTKKPETNQFFSFEISSAQQALLVPLIRVFKMEYPTENGNVVPNSSPSRTIEIEFDSYALTSDVEKILSAHAGKLPSTGIESFEWSLKGVNPGEVDNNIEASLKIHFNTVSSLFFDNLRRRQQGAGVEGTASFLDLIIFAPAFKEKRGKNGEIGGNLSCLDSPYEGKFFEIKVDVGWAVPDDKGGLFTTEQKEFIRQSKASLFLQLTDHEFDFKEDGSATLTANYRARSALVDERYDILGLLDVPYHFAAQVDESAWYQNAEYRDAGSTAGTLREFREGTDNLQTDPRDEPLPDADRTSASVTKDKRTEDEKALEETIAARREKESQFLRFQYKKIIYELLLKHVYACTIPYALLLNQRATDKGTKEAIGAGDPDPTTTAGGAPALGDEGVLEANPSITAGEVYDAPTFYGGMFDAATGNIADEWMRDASSHLKEAYRQHMKNVKVVGPMQLQSDYMNWRYADQSDVWAADSNQLNPFKNLAGASDGTAAAPDAIPDSTEDGPFIQFFYLGDILEVFLKKDALAHEVSNKTKAFVTTDIEFLNPRLIVDNLSWTNESFTLTGVGSGKKHIDKDDLNCGFRGVSRAKRRNYTSVLNIANIPINVELFLDFLKRKIIANQRVTYYLEDFLQDLSNEFVKPIFLQTGLVTANSAPVNFITNFTTAPSVKLLSGDKFLGYPMGRWHSSGFKEHTIDDRLSLEALSTRPGPAILEGPGPYGDTPTIHRPQEDVPPAGSLRLEDIDSFEPPPTAAAALETAEAEADTAATAALALADQ